MTGVFILIEGGDRSGKTTQAKLLVERIGDDKAVFMHFPVRITAIGKLIDQHLNGQHSDLSDEAVHLLFSANRWEFRDQILKHLEQGTHVVMDRYTYSGLAFSMAKGLDEQWCRSCDNNLPEPDMVFFLDVEPEEALQRCGDTQERYETLLFQSKVLEAYRRIMPARTITINVSGLDVEQVHQRIAGAIRARRGYVGLLRTNQTVLRELEILSEERDTSVCTYRSGNREPIFLTAHWSEESEDGFLSTKDACELELECSDGTILHASRKKLPDIDNST